MSSVEQTIRAVLDTHKYEQYGVCACGHDPAYCHQDRDLRVEWGKYKQGLRQHVAEELAKALGNRTAGEAKVVVDALTDQLDVYVALHEEVRSTLTQVADHMDEFAYDELATHLDDGALDEYGRTYRSRLARVRDLAAGPTSDGYRPYAVDIDDEVHLAILLDDLRAALGDEGDDR